MRLAFVVLCLAACGDPKAKVDAPIGPNQEAGNPGDGGPTDGTMTVDADPACPTPGVIPTMQLVPVVTGLSRPVWVTAPKGSTDLYVVEEVGRIRIVRNGATLPTPFLDLTGKVFSPGGGVPDGEAGLLGLAFANDYATSGRFFVYLNVDIGGTPSVGLYEYHRNAANHDIADTTATPLLEHNQNEYGNIAGHIAFGQDGYLYISVGDGNSSPSVAPDISSPRGKILRLDVNNPTAAIPGNVTGGEPHVWDYGLRNPYRFTFDRLTGDMYIMDAGDTHGDEFDIEPKNTGKRDYGWPRMEGAVCAGGGTSCANQGTLPALDILHAPVSSVAIPGAVYRGAALPCLRGRFLYAMHGLSTVHSFIWNGSAVTNQVELTDMFASADLFNVSGIGEDAAGELYFTTLPGVVYKLAPN